MNFKEAIAQHQERGFLEACVEALKSAMVDQRFRRAHRLIIVCLVEYSNSKTCTSWPSRAIIASETGLSEQTISNRLHEMKSWGYIIAERILIAEAGRTLTHYTFPQTEKLRELRMEIAAYCNAVKARDELPAGGELTHGRVTKVTHGRVSHEEVTHGRVTKVTHGRVTNDESYPPAGMKTPKVTRPRGTVIINNRKEVSKCTPDTLFADLPQEGGVKRFSSSVTVHLPDAEPQRVALLWLKGQRSQVEDGVLLDFAEVELRRFVDERPTTKTGQPMSLYGFLGVAFTYRFDEWFSRRNAVPGAQPDPFRPVRGSSGQWTRAGNLIRDEDMPDFSKLRPIGDLSEVE